MSYFVTYAEETNEDHGLLVYGRPNISVAEENITEHEIPGREADLTERSGRYKNVNIDVTFNYACSADQWGKVFREAVIWLRKTGNLILSDDDEVYRKVLYVKIAENARTLRRVGKFIATFVCAPGEYLVEGAEFIDIASLAQTVDGSTYTIYNPYSECRPVYLFTGGGDFTMSVNSNEIGVVVPANLTVDTDRKIAYKDTWDMANTNLTGDYDDMVLLPGENTIQFAGEVKLEIQPNWRVL